VRQVCIHTYLLGLSQFQAKESTEINKITIDKIKHEISKLRITDYNLLTNQQLKGILKYLKLNDHYEHIPYIKSRLTNKTAPTISREEEDQLLKMFDLIQEPFKKHCPKNRINFLSYSYVLHKFCELRELDEFINCFPLLKSRTKLRVQDEIWKKICNELKWEYIPSV
jgi:hypothetical protein